MDYELDYSNIQTFIEQSIKCKICYTNDKSYEVIFSKKNKIYA